VRRSKFRSTTVEPPMFPLLIPPPNMSPMPPPFPACSRIRKINARETRRWITATIPSNNVRTLSRTGPAYKTGPITTKYGERRALPQLHREHKPIDPWATSAAPFWLISRSGKPIGVRTARLSVSGEIARTLPAPSYVSPAPTATIVFPSPVSLTPPPASSRPRKTPPCNRRCRGRPQRRALRRPTGNEARYTRSSSIVNSQEICKIFLSYALSSGASLIQPVRQPLLLPPRRGSDHPGTNAHEA